MVWKEFSADTSGGEISYQCDISPPLKTDKEKKYKTCRAEKRCERKPIRRTPGQVTVLASEPLQEIIEYYWNASDKRGPLSWRSIELATRDRANQLDIKLGVWQSHCEILGVERAALCLMIADRNSSRSDGYRVKKSSAAAFVGMVRAEARQVAVIDGLLGELISFAGGQRE